MWEAFIKMLFLMFTLPFLIFLKGYEMFKEYMSKGNRWHNFPYALLSILIALLIILLLYGYRW